MITPRLHALSAVALAGLVGCATVPVAKAPVVESVAILPFDNESNELDAPEILQRLVYLALKRSPYAVQDVESTNAFLREKAGIVDGGQLAALDPQKLGSDLGVQALLFGNVESFGYTNIGVYVSRKVRLELKMVDAATGATLWEHAATGATRRIALNEEQIKENFALGLADQLVDKLFDSPLEPEARQATISTLRTLPGFRFAGFFSDDAAAAKRGLKRGLKRAINPRRR